jgi:hypothetical protein
MDNPLQRVWITTVDHLRRFREICDRTSLLNRMRGEYSLPAGFPRAVLPRVGQPPLQIPLAILSTGNLSFNSERLEYSYEPKQRYKYLRDLSFTTPIQGLEISMVQFDYAPIRLFNLPYISFRVRNMDPQDLLVSAKGFGPFAFLNRRRTKSLFYNLVEAGSVPLTSNNRWSGRGS